MTLDGPPPVNGIMISKSWREPKIERKTERRIVGSKIGILIRHAVVNGPAPSTLAASKTS